MAWKFAARVISVKASLSQAQVHTFVCSVSAGEYKSRTLEQYDPGGWSGLRSWQHCSERGLFFLPFAQGHCRRGRSLCCDTLWLLPADDGERWKWVTRVIYKLRNFLNCKIFKICKKSCINWINTMFKMSMQLVLYNLRQIPPSSLPATRSAAWEHVYNGSSCVHHQLPPSNRDVKNKENVTESCCYCHWWWWLWWEEEKYYS